jgi:hypothetical protein
MIFLTCSKVLPVSTDAAAAFNALDDVRVLED